MPAGAVHTPQGDGRKERRNAEGDNMDSHPRQRRAGAGGTEITARSQGCKRQERKDNRDRKNRDRRPKSLSWTGTGTRAPRPVNSESSKIPRSSSAVLSGA